MSFSLAHILLTAAITAALTLGAAWWRLPRGAWPDILAIALLSGVAVFAWRVSANVPQLNSDGLPGFSANDWAAPILAFVVLTVYTDLRAPSQLRGYRQARALATLAALTVNVITI
jgi:hypothetical protein